jgi:hypothetical protein
MSSIPRQTPAAPRTRRISSERMCPCMCPGCGREAGAWALLCHLGFSPSLGAHGQRMGIATRKGGEWSQHDTRGAMRCRSIEHSYWHVCRRCGGPCWRGWIISCRARPVSVQTLLHVVWLHGLAGKRCCGSDITRSRQQSEWIRSGSLATVLSLCRCAHETAVVCGVGMWRV